MVDEWCVDRGSSMGELKTFETLDHLATAADENYLTDTQYAELRAHSERVWKVLNGYVAYLKKSILQNPFLSG
jgi:hypothetical protein